MPIRTQNGMVVDYREDIEESIAAPVDEETDSMGDSHSNIAMKSEMTDEQPADDLEDHMAMGNEAVLGGEAELEASAYGEAEFQPEAEMGEELESVDGYDESLLEMNREETYAKVEETKLLDAWYAEFADPVARALALQQPKLEEATQEVVIGKDDRVRITATTKYPWRTICALRITAADGSKWIGTGWLVGHRTLITAGHVVYIHSRGGWVKNIEVIPGCNGNSRPYGSCIATAFRSVKGWTKSKKRSHDYGAIVLPPNCNYGKRLGYFGYANLGLTSLLGLKVNLSGYPGDKPSCTQWWHARRIKFVTPRTFVYNIDTAGGQSGSPVWRLKNGQRHAVGIHTNGAPSGNSATRITKPVFKNIKAWKAEGM
ncbi:MAG: serine protease [Nitrospira sp.]|nr:serine protease [Nitrospira sp.]